MAHFAQLDETNVVLRVIVVNNEVIENKSFPDSEPIGIVFCQSHYGVDTKWVQTSYNRTFRKNYAGGGSTYDPIRDAFIAPQPFPSWLLDEDTCQWTPPTPVPTDGAYVWDEPTKGWVKQAV